MSNWIQPVLISSENKKSSNELFDPCLDTRSWAVLKFCLEKKPSISISPNLLRPIARVSRHALVGCSDGLLEQFFECVSLVITSNSRAFYNAGVDLWINCAIDVSNLVYKVFSKEGFGFPGGKSRLEFAISLLEHFSTFLRFYPNPKNVFRVFVDRLLDPLLELLVLLHSQDSGENAEGAKRSLKAVEGVLSNGLFHPAHTTGFFNVKNLDPLGREGGVKGSYHNHLFHRFSGIKENKAVVLSGFGYLFRLFLDRTKTQKGAQHKEEASEDEPKETKKPIFEVFTQFMQPILLECKAFSNTKVADLEEIKLVEMHCMLKSINEIVMCVNQENIYVPTEDTVEGSHFNYLKEVHEIIVSIADVIYLFWVSKSQSGGESMKKIVALVSKEIFVAVGNFLEIEYRTLGDQIVDVWLIMFAFMAINFCSEDTRPRSLLIKEILSLGTQIINVFGELRQVANPLFALLQAIKLHAESHKSLGLTSSFPVGPLHLSSRDFLSSLTTMLCSTSLRLSISNSVRSMPERQAGSFIEELKVDLVGTLKWMADSILDFDLKAEILGRILSELYSLLLNSFTVTSSNSTLVGNSVEKLIGEIRPSFSPLLENKPEKENRNQNGNKNETVFICCLLGGNSIPWRAAISWAMVFFFRLYASCRSLYRQSICLMPPDQAKKSSELFGSAIATNFGAEWRKYSTSINLGYFSWISDPSISLLDLIQSLSDALFSEINLGRFSLTYSLVIMAFQRLHDLNREIQVSKVLQKEQDYSGRDKKQRKKIKEKACDLEVEVAGLTDFLIRNVITFENKLNSSGNMLILRSCSSDESSFMVEFWGILCRNIDIWGLYASKRGLRRFFSCLLYYCISNDRGDGEKEVIGNRDVLCAISLELLGSLLIYDEPVLANNLMSRFCHLLKGSLTTVMNYLAVDVDLECLPDWSETNLVFCSTNIKENTDEKSVSPLTDELRNCERLLNLLQNMPAVIFNAKTSCRLTNYILHLERLVAWNILNNCGNSFAYKPSDLLRIFLSCRRVLRHIITSSDEWCLQSKLFLKVSKIFGNRSTLEWLLNSLQRISREKSSQNLKELLFYSSDHTSHIFLKCAEIFFSFSLSKGEKLISLYSNDETNGRESSKVCLAWRCAESLAQTIDSQIKMLQITKRGGIDSCFNIISCLQRFLWGLVSTLQEVNRNSFDLKLWCWSKLEGSIGSFENFVDICLYLMLSEGETLWNDLPDLHVKNDMVNFGAFMRKWVKTKKQDETFSLPFSQFCERASVERVSLFKRLFTDETLEMQFTIRELFVASGAIFKLRCMMVPPSGNPTIPMGKVSIANAVLHVMADSRGWPGKFSFTWIEGVLQFLEVVAGHVNKFDHDFSKEVYSQLISSHLGVLGKCISLERKRAKLSIHDTGSNTKCLNPIEESDQDMINGLTRFKSRVRISLKKLIRDNTRSMVMILVQAVERALVGVEKGFHAVCDINIGSTEGGCGNASPSVAAGVDCLYLVLESLSGKERALKKTIPSLVGCLFNIILHLEGPNIVCSPKVPSNETNSNPDAGAVVLMCVEVLTTVIGRHSCPMDACHVSQCLHIPTTLFRNLTRIKELSKNGFTIDRQYLIDLYAACCKLICATLKHRIREVRPCVALLEDSTTALLTCLESDNDNMSCKSTQFAWEMQEAIKCASFFRRIYEEIRQQKDVLANNSFYFLATYISVYSGYGPSQAGIKREVDEALRPGVYSLIDICTQSDLQQLHTVLGEGPCRNTLASLLHDYKIHFQYEGKI
ncbi:Urb2/Npa2 family protein [Rhynchospora pubera]|uniref:Urb2/Npa2 family protein n=1 Tax=Rhynchospora pubera TaxID=906938 RepID=A0AAV8HXE3_9POAL|nr:Urb2/Npa2 family protein [Rhynchospora pubera]